MPYRYSKRMSLLSSSRFQRQSRGQ
jgi:hypothetical protein